jgi:hypothetical protein
MYFVQRFVGNRPPEGPDAAHPQQGHFTMNHDFEGPAWAEHHKALSDSFGTAIDKLAYRVGALISRRRAEQRRAHRAAQFN